MSKKQRFDKEKYICDLAEFIKKNHSLITETEYVRGVFELGIREYIRDRTDGVIPCMSKEAAEVLSPIIKKLMLTRCPSKNKVRKFDTDIRSIIDKKLEYEHQFPLAQGAKECLKKGKSRKDIEKILAQMFTVVWITTEENDRLNKSGYKKNRPIDAYDIVKPKIEIIA